MHIHDHPVVSREQWLAARRQHLVHEKAFTRERDKLSAERRALPWVKIDKGYRFQGATGELGLADLFGGRSQLVIYHFMYGDGWDEGCPGCSFLADHIDGANQHLSHHDVALVAVSHAPCPGTLPLVAHHPRRPLWPLSACVGARALAWDSAAGTHGGGWANTGLRAASSPRPVGVGWRPPRASCRR